MRQSLCLTLTLLAAASAAPAAAQSFEQAVRQNLATAIEHCLRTLPNGPVLLNTLTLNGFGTGLKDDFGNGETMHRFYAPAETAEIWVKNSSGNGAHCFISSNHISASATVALIGEVLEARFPGKFTAGEPDGGRTVTVDNPRSNRLCTGYFGDAGNGSFAIHVGADTIDPTCRDDGTVAITIAP